MKTLEGLAPGTFKKKRKNATETHLDYTNHKF